MPDWLLLIGLMALLIGLLLVRPRRDDSVWRYHSGGQMRRKVNGEWQYRPATEQEQREHEVSLAEDYP